MVGVPARHGEGYTYADYLSWDDEGRRELIDGEIFDMSPAPSRKHQAILGSLFAQLHRAVEDHPCKVYAAPFDVRFPEHPSDGDERIATVVQPDIVVVCDEEKLDDRGCRGAPDFIVEIVSPASAAQDQIRKVRVYERFGVGEYWIVHPADGLVTVRLLGPEGRYGVPTIHEGTGRLALSVLEGVELDLTAAYGAE